PNRAGKTNPISGRWQGAWGLCELRVFQTFLDNLRPICSGHRYPARRATLVAAWFKKPLPERPRRLAVKPPSAQALRVQASSFEQNRFAMGKTAISLVSPRPQQLAPSGRARLLLEPRRSAVLNSGLTTGPPAGLGGGLGPFLAVCTPRFSTFLNILRLI